MKSYFSFSWKRQMFSFSAIMFFSFPISAQTVFFTEDFTAGGTGWTLNLNSGTNAANANVWVINNDASCTCGTGNKLHITCDPNDSNCPIFGGPGCTYNAGGLTAIATDKFVSSPNISTAGKTNITLTFSYQSAGEAGNDYAVVRLSNDGGTTWTDLTAQYAGTSTCTQATVNIPASYENTTDFRIAFRWMNNDNTAGNDPPFSVDNITLSVPVTTGVANVPQDFFQVFSSGNKITIHTNGKYKINAITDILGKTISFAQNNNEIIVDSGKGIYFLEIISGENTLVKKVFIH